MGRAHVGGQIGERKIHLVADRAHHGHAQARHAPHHALVVERHQVLARAATATEHHHIEPRIALDQVQRTHDAGRGIFTLNERRREHDFHVATPKGDRHDVVERGARSARHHADDARRVGQRALALDREQPLLREPLFQLLQRFEQRAASRGTHFVDHELQSPARRPNRRLPDQLQACTLVQVPARAQRVEAVHHALDDRVLGFILERKVDVAARRALQRAHFTFDPSPGRNVFDRSAQAPVELRHTDDLFRPAHRAVYSSHSAGLRCIRARPRGQGQLSAVLSWFGRAHHGRRATRALLNRRGTRPPTTRTPRALIRTRAEQRC